MTVTRAVYYDSVFDPFCSDLQHFKVYTKFFFACVGTCPAQAHLRSSREHPLPQFLRFSYEISSDIAAYGRLSNCQSTACNKRIASQFQHLYKV